VNRGRELTCRAPTEQEAPPCLRGGGGDLPQVPRPEQPALAVGQAHVYGYAVLSPVTGHNRTQKGLGAPGLCGVP
jgi:hypothetical protein